MKNNSSAKISLLFVIFSFLLMVLAEPVKAESILTLPSLNVSALQTYKGRYLTAIYVVSTAAGLSLEAEHPSVKTIYKQTQPILISGNSVSLDPQSIAWTGLSKPNIILLVVHDLPNFKWINGSNTAKAVSTLSIKQVLNLAQIKPNASIDITFLLGTATISN